MPITSKEIDFLKYELEMALDTIEDISPDINLILNNKSDDDDVTTPTSSQLQMPITSTSTVQTDTPVSNTMQAQQQQQRKFTFVSYHSCVKFKHSTAFVKISTQFNVYKKNFPSRDHQKVFQ